MGDSWTRSEASPKHASFQIHAFRSGRALSVGFWGAALSTDGARSFRPIPSLFDTSLVSFDLTHLVVLDGFTAGSPGDSAESRVLIAGTQRGRAGNLLWATDDEGDTWRLIHVFEYGGDIWGGLATVPDSVGGGPGWAVAVESYHHVSPSVLREGRVFATVDGGETWVVIGQVPTTGLKADGLVWRAQTAAVGPDGRLYVGTTKPGPSEIWSWRTRGRVADAIRLAVASEGSPKAEFDISLAVYPNPTGSTATIQIETTELGDVHLAVYDLRGRQVAEVYAGPLAAGASEWHVETGSWAAGVYVVRAESGGLLTTARLTVAR